MDEVAHQAAHTPPEISPIAHTEPLSVRATLSDALEHLQAARAALAWAQSSTFISDQARIDAYHWGNRCERLIAEMRAHPERLVQDGK